MWVKRYKTVTLFAEFEFEVISDSSWCRCRTSLVSERIKRSREKQNSVVIDTDDLQLNENKRMQNTWRCFTLGAFGFAIVANLSFKTWPLCIASSCSMNTVHGYHLVSSQTHRHKTRPMLSPLHQPKNEQENAVMESTKNYIACNRLNLHTNFGSSTPKCRLSNIRKKRAKIKRNENTRTCCKTKEVFIVYRNLLWFSVQK